MIISGGSRSNWRFFASHLLRTDENERVEVTEIKGLLSQDVREAFREMDAVADATKCKNFFYHCNMNPRVEERLSPAQWEAAIDRLEHNLGLDGHARFVVEHEKGGRVHRHVVWSRIDVDSMTAVSDSFTAPVHERTAREIEAECGLAPVESVLVKDRDTARPERGPQGWEHFRGAASGVDPRAMKAELTALWQEADSGLAFRAALESAGYILARGDRRDFCVIDPTGEEHSLARRLSGVKAADIRARMADVDRERLPGVDEARELARADADTGGDARDREQRHQAGRLVDAGAQGQQSDEEAARWNRHVDEIRSGTPFPTDAGEWLGRHYRPMSSDLGEIARNPPPPPAGWLSRMRHVAEYMTEVWHEEESDNPVLDIGRGGMLLHAARVFKHLLHRDDEKTEVTAPEAAKAPESFTDRVVKGARDILGNERGAAPNDRFEAWWNAMREHLGEWMQPHHWHSHDGHDLDGPDHDTGPDIDIGR